VSPTDEVGGRFADEYAPRPVLDSRLDFEGAVWSVRSDRVDLGAAGEVVRDYVVHPGAVAVIALDDADRVLLVRQYRHPVRSLCWEPPAGLRDDEDPEPLRTAQRELAEETGHTAERWYRLLELRTTPGGSDEALTIYLARDLRAVPEGQRHVRTDEELDMQVAWAPFAAVRAGVLAGRLANPALVSGILAAHLYREAGWAGLVPVE
jgi:ADP-ribose pyrophosphatase